MVVFQNLSWKILLVDNVLLSHDHELYPTVSFDENYLEPWSETDRISYLDLTFRNQFGIWNWPEVAIKQTCKTKEFENGQKKESKGSSTDKQRGEDFPVPLYTDVYIFFHLVVDSTLSCTSTTNNFINKMNSTHSRFTNATTPKELFLKTTDFTVRRVWPPRRSC